MKMQRQESLWFNTIAGRTHTHTHILQGRKQRILLNRFTQNIKENIKKTTLALTTKRV